MDLQQVVIDLFQEQRIDKATAYRLLAECRKATPIEPVAERLVATARLPDAGGDDIAALVAWLLLLQLVTGKSELACDHVDPAGAVALRVSLDGLDAAQLRDELATQLARGEAPAEAAPYAWVSADAGDTASRLVRATVRRDDGWRVEIDAAPELEGATRHADWPDTLAQLHRALVARPDAPLHALDKLPTRHRRLLADYNATAMYLPPQRTLPALLAPVIELEHDAVAVETSAGRLDYAQYREHAYRLAHRLRRLDVARNERVAVVLRRGCLMPPSLFGVVCSGGAYVPLEPDLPADRLAGILADTGARVLVTDADTLHQGILPLAGSNIAHVVCVDAWPRRHYQGVPVSDAAALATEPASVPRPVNRPEDLCYVIYTSGSTGKPKGVMISHLNIVNTLIGVNNVFNVGGDDRILCFSSYGFDLSVWDFFGAALAGACVFVPTKAETRDPAALLRILREYGITVWDSVPTGMSQLLLPLAGNADLATQVETLRLAMLSGEFIPLALPADIRRAFPNCRVASLGGATEGTVWSIYHYPVDVVDPRWKSIPYGRPLPNQRFYVLNDDLQPCAIGEKGMLYIGGLGVGQGYFGDAERSARAFIAAPWPNEPGGRIYRTGDLGVMRADGVIEIAGRADQQVKIRGFRVELGEVESQLNQLPGIDQAAVIVRQEADAPPRLVAFYVSRQGEIAADALRRQLSAHLPDYMIPAQFAHLNHPPVGATGKLDRKALAALRPGGDGGREGMGLDYVAPQDDTERRLAEELARIIRLERVGVDDDFFLIGGDSLLALQYLSVLAQLGFAASPLDLQRGRTIRGVLARVRRLDESDAASDDAPVAPGPMGRKFLERMPLTDRQHWNQSLVIRFDHLPPPVRLQAALQRVIDHHPLLRARLVGDELLVAPRGAAAALPLIDLSRQPLWRRTATYRAQVEALQRAIRYDDGQPCRAVLIRLRPDDVRLVWVAHHLMVDAHCWRVMVEDLAAAFREPDASLLRATPYAAHVAHVAAQTEAACDELVTRPPLLPMALPGKASGQPGRERDAALLPLALSVAETRRVFQCLRHPGAPALHLLLLSALSGALKDWTGEAEVRFDVVSNGREVDPASDLSRTVGWFATHNPYAATVADDAGALLAGTAVAWRAHQAQARYFVAACNAARSRPDHPYAGYRDQALLYNYLGVFDSLDLPEGWQVLGSAGNDRGGDNLRTHALELDALVAGGRLRLGLRHDAALPRRHARRLLRLFRGRLLALTAHLEGTGNLP
ncbi:non-ribosomal peptide synthetase [Chitiniphilus eburneus]|nr:non-ribosomal peptide synthetase [Chitiniphilus eburneus]